MVSRFPIDTSNAKKLTASRVDPNAIPPEELRARYVSAGFANFARTAQEDWYCLLREVQGAAALPHILKGTLSHPTDDTAFESNALFCEWVYYVDWNERKMVVSGMDVEKREKAFADLSEEWMLALEDKEPEGGRCA